MNLIKLREAEALFLLQFPDGFEDYALEQTRKKHNVNTLVDAAQSRLTKQHFAHTAQVLDDIVKIVSRSSMISMFEKPKFRDFIQGMNRDDREFLARGFQRLLHGKAEQGFADVVDVLTEGKLAKWSLVTLCPMYLRPKQEVFVKPTTTKNVIRQFELDNLVYHPRPSWAFYIKYRTAIDRMKAVVAPSLSPNNAAFTGFLMMSSAVKP